MRSLSGTKIKGLYFSRTMTILKGALGGGHSSEELAVTYGKLLRGARYQKLKEKKEKSALTEEEATELADCVSNMDALKNTVDEGMREMKKLQLEQLRRLRKKYGRYGGQLHPEDFMERAGSEFTDDFALIQDALSMLDNGKEYFEPGNKDDEEFETLVKYYNAVYWNIHSYAMAKDGPAPDSRQHAYEHYDRRDCHATIRQLEHRIDGEGFSDEEQAAYEAKVRQRARNGEPLQVLGRFKTQEMRDAEEKAEEAIKALSAEEKKQASCIRGLEAVKKLLAEVTNGTLVVPEGTEVLDFSKQRPKEEGSVERGSKRNAIIRGFSYWSDQKDTPLFSHEPTVNDLKQRMVSNCYMVAGTAGLVNVAPELLKECIKDNMDGTVTVRLYKKEISKKEPDQTPANTEAVKTVEQTTDDGGLDVVEILDEDQIQTDQDVEVTYRPVYVRVSKEVPRIAGADALSAGTLWMQMIEKACAFVGREQKSGKEIKGYKSLWYGQFYMEFEEFLEKFRGITRTDLSKLEQNLT